MSWLKKALVGIAFLLLTGADDARADFIIFRDDFNSEGSGGVPYLTFQKWNALDGTVDVIAAPSPTGSFDPYPASGLFVDLAGSGTNPGKLETKDTFSLDPGEYRLQFLLAGPQLPGPNPPPTVLVTLGSVYAEAFNLPIDQPFTLYTRTITIATPATGALSFQQTVGDHFAGALLDDVVLSSVNAVPAPHTFGLVMSGGVFLLGAYWIKRRPTSMNQPSWPK